jgi:PPOX class probable F420-dependent enzyme
MGVRLSENVRKKLTDPNFGFLADVMEDGWPHVSPVWVDVEGDRILVNTAAGRVKERNVRRDPRVALSVADAADPYDRVDIRGRVLDFTHGDRAVEHINELHRKYRPWSKEPYPLPPGQERVILHIEPLVVDERPS